MIFLKYVFLLIAIMYTFSNVGKIFYKDHISSFQIIAMAVGIVGYILLEFELGF